jgi:hypothetical protein
MPTSNIAAMRRVSAYRTTDGTVHEDRDAAVRHQAHIDLADLLAKHIPPSDDQRSMHDFAVELVRDADTVAKLLRLARRGL